MSDTEYFTSGTFYRELMIPVPGLLMSHADGAALFSISSLHPATTSRLKAYIYHRLCARVSSMTTAGETDVHQGLLSKAFPHRANALDREQLVIPSGWDTHGKIKILRNGFSPEDLIEAWSSIDVLSDKHHRSGPTPAGSSACQMYKQVIGDSEPGIKVSLAEAITPPSAIMGLSTNLAHSTRLLSLGSVTRESMRKTSRTSSGSTTMFCPERLRSVKQRKRQRGSKEAVVQQVQHRCKIKQRGSSRDSVAAVP